MRKEKEIERKVTIYIRRIRTFGMDYCNNALSHPGHFIQDFCHLSSLGRDYPSPSEDVCSVMFAWRLHV